MSDSHFNTDRYLFVSIATIFLFIIFLVFISDKISAGLSDSILIKLKSKKVLTGFTVTAYCPGPCCNGAWQGMTSSGIPMSTYADRGISIAAVDPTVIPLGSYIRFRNKKYLAADVGTLIKGKTIDILVPDHNDTYVFGKHSGETIHVIYEKK